MVGVWPKATLCTSWSRRDPGANPAPPSPGIVGSFRATWGLSCSYPGASFNPEFLGEVLFHHLAVSCFHDIQPVFFFWLMLLCSWLVHFPGGVGEGAATMLVFRRTGRFRVQEVLRDQPGLQGGSSWESKLSGAKMWMHYWFNGLFYCWRISFIDLLL